MSSVALDDSQALQQRVEDAIAAATGKRPRIISFQRQPTGCSSSYQTERFILTLEGSGTLDLFVKNFAASLLHKSKLNRRCERERLVYQRLLVNADLGTPRFYGWLDDEETGRGTLLLEHVKGMRLEKCDPRHWPLAAAWLARMHAYIKSHPDLPAGAGSLVRHDEQFFWSQAERTAQSLREHDAAWARRFEGLLGNYHRCVNIMVDQEPTLVHGSYRQKDILLDLDEPRICPIDWERAAIGSRFFDLAHLSEGMSLLELEQFTQAYRLSAEQVGLRLPPREQMSRVITCFHLHRIMDRLRKWPGRPDKASACQGLIERAETIAGGL
jgi:hypothetical protein